ncbi:MAG TPA: right-handed parallel beta-helix repeat-containing protein [Candidatus Omnitrophota bacterium]|nr:right-handed parallel beta-helix repeat-containing protein [Candidatus Omnitrophota bacterium]
MVPESRPSYAARRQVGASSAAALAALTLLALALTAVAPRDAEARRRLVPRQHKTLQAAIDAAAPGDTIRVAPGVYPGPFSVTKPLALVGESGAEKTILDGRDSVRVLRIEGTSGVTVTGFTIRRGHSNSGGGIYCLRDSTVQIAECAFTGNWESAISIWDSQGVAVSGCTLRENKGSAIDANNSVIAVFESKFYDNEGHEGGAISLSRTRLLVPLRNIVFERNRAVGSIGGALCVADTSQGSVANCSFKENSSDVAGGALGITGGSTFNISRTSFEKNQAGAGGAVQCDHSRMNMGLCLFNQNSSLAFGAALGIGGRGMNNINPTLQSNTFFENHVKGDGATLFFTDVSPEVRKNIFVVDHGQRAVTGLQTSPRYDCNLIWDPSGGAIGALPSVNTWVGDPLFCDAEHGNFALRDLSPALRAPCGPIGAFIGKAGCSSFRLQPAN